MAFTLPDCEFEARRIPDLFFLSAGTQHLPSVVRQLRTGGRNFLKQPVFTVSPIGWPATLLAGRPISCRLFECFLRIDLERKAKDTKGNIAKRARIRPHRWSYGRTGWKVGFASVKRRGGRRRIRTFEGVSQQSCSLSKGILDRRLHDYYE